MTSFRAVDIKGFSPAVEPTRSQELFVLNGRNYIFDTKGPKSIFGNRLLLPQKLGQPAFVQGVRLRLRSGDRAFTITSDAILEWSESKGGWSPIFVIPNTANSPYRWTFAYINRKMYFCHPRTGILVYDVDSEFTVPHEGPGVATDAISIAECNGRLTSVSPTLFQWSSPSDGMDFEPRLGGGGFQLIAARVPGEPIMVTSYTRGCLTWTTGGVMRSEFTGEAEVFRHRSLNTEYRPINSFCTSRVDDDTVVILDERGLFQSRGEALQPYSPLFNEFLAAYIQKNDLRVGNNVRLEWDELQRFMFVSVSLSEIDPLYEEAFVLYPNLDKWGQFNERHYGILPIKITNSDRADDYYGFVDSDGFLRYWLSTGSREDSDFSGRVTANLYYPPVQKPVGYQEDEPGRILSASGVLNTFNDILTLQPASFYPRDGFAPLPPILTGLDSSVQIGLLRLQDGDSNERLSEVINILIRSVQSGEADQLTLDYTLVPDGVSDEDWEIVAEGEDYGFDVLNYVNHGIRLIGTVDGKTEFQVKVPDLVKFNKAARYYACNCVGIWHILEITAIEIGESFHPITFELTATDAGRFL